MGDEGEIELHPPGDVLHIIITVTFDNQNQPREDQLLNMDPISMKVENLRLCAAADPKHQENIDAVIRYYQAGGRFPIPGKEVVYCFDGETAKLGTHEEYCDECLVQKKAGWWDVRGIPGFCAQLLCVR